MKTYWTVPGVKIPSEISTAEYIDLLIKYLTLFPKLFPDQKVSKIHKNLVFSETRKGAYPLVRYYIFYFLKVEQRLSNAEIGRLFNRDRTTVLHGVQTIKNLISSYDEIKEELKELNQLV